MTASYGRSARILLTSLLAALAIITLAGIRPSEAETRDPATWCTDGEVYATHTLGDTAYFGGDFTYVGLPSGMAVVANRSTGAMVTGFPRVLGDGFPSGSFIGIVRASAPDGAGGWYVSGDFSSVGDETRYNVAHVMSDGTLAAWNPSPSQIEIYSIAFSGSTTLYGGSGALFAVDATTAVPKSWSPLSPNGIVFAIVPGPNATVYVGGNFNQIGGQSRGGLAQIDLQTGAVTAWNPNLAGTINSIAVRPGAVFVGGSFNSNSTGMSVGEVDPVTGAVTGFNPLYAFTTNAVVVHGNSLYAGGEFGNGRHYLAQYDIPTHTMTAWNPQPNARVYSLVVEGSTVYAGGSFGTVGGTGRAYVAAIDSVTGLVTSWDMPDPNRAVRTMCAGASGILVGGEFRLVDARYRPLLAAIDLVTGRATSWNPPTPNDPTRHPDSDISIVTALEVQDSTVYIGGYFPAMGSTARNGTAAVNARTGALLAWVPGWSGTTVSDILADGNRVYLAGSAGAMAVDAISGASLPWNAQSNSGVYALVKRDTTIYLGGAFTTVRGGVARNRLAALGRESATLLPWNPGADAPVRDLLALGSNLYVGGDFQTLGGFTRRRLGAFDLGSGTLQPFNPSADGPVRSIATNGSRLYVGGDFHQLGGRPRRGLGVLDPSGALYTFRADADFEPYTGLSAPVASVSVSGNRVAVGGAFTNIGPPGQVEEAFGLGFAQFIDTSNSIDNTIDVPRVVGENQLAISMTPNPVVARGQVTFALPTRSPVKVEILDLAGRKVKTVLDSESWPAGTHSVPLSLGNAPGGIYFARIVAGGRSATTKIAVLGR